MKKLLATVFFALLPVASALTWAEVLQPTDTQIRAACADGFKVYSLSRSSPGDAYNFNVANREALVGRLLHDRRGGIANVVRPIDIKPPTAQAYAACAAQAGTLKATPDVPAASSLLTVAIPITVAKPEQTEKYPALLIFLSSNGKELRRLEPTGSALGQDWKANCAGRSCRWENTSTYTFDIRQFPTDFQTMRVLFSRGTGVEQRDYLPDDFKQGSLSK